MPTMKSRLRWIPQAISQWRNQTWPRESRELLLVSEDDLASSLPSDVRFLQLNGAFTVGTKRNVACEHASGELIAHWDDDDWSHAARISEQVAELDGCDLAGYRTMPFHDLVSGDVWHWRGNGFALCGTSMMYRRDYWKENQFKDKQVAEDVEFNKRCRRVKPLDNHGRMVARFHGDSVTRGTAKFGGMKPGKWEDLPEEYRQL